jgi:hemolysin III
MRVRQTAPADGGPSMESILVEPHYTSPGALRADLIVHLIGLTIALFGGGILLGLAFQRHSPALVVAVSIYVAGFVAMLGFSVAYNFAPHRWRPLLRRLDHAGIFLMIAGSYTLSLPRNCAGRGRSA